MFENLETFYRYLLFLRISEAETVLDKQKALILSLLYTSGLQRATFCQGPIPFKIGFSFA